MKRIVSISALLALMYLTANQLAAQNLQPEYTEWYAGVKGGVTLSGMDQIPNCFGLHGAYFFNEKYGGGMVVQMFSDGNDKSFVIAPAFFAHWGIGSTKFFIPTRIGFGFEKRSDSVGSTIYYAGYASAGIAYRPSKLISFGINVDFASSVYFAVNNIGFNIGLSFHF